MKESEGDCHQIDREGVNVTWVTHCKLLEEERKPWAEFTSARSGDEISVVRGY